MTSQKPRRRLPLAAAACVLLLSLTACAQSAAVTPAAAGEAPAKVEKNAETGIAKLTVTEHGLARIDLKTEPVTAGTGTDVLLPYASLLYDANGKTWVYTNPEPRPGCRSAVTVDKIADNKVQLRSGPPAGTDVVTIGAAELFGAEFGTKGH